MELVLWNIKSFQIRIKNKISCFCFVDYLASQGWENVCKWGWVMRQSIHLSILPVQWGRTCKLSWSIIREMFGNQAKNTSKCENALCEQSKVLNSMIDFVAGPSSYKAVDPRGPGLCQSQWLLSCRGLSIFKWLSAIFVKCDHRQIYICKFWHNFATLTSVTLLKWLLILLLVYEQPLILDK